MEAVVDSITTLDNKVSLPVSVDYTTKAEKPETTWKNCLRSM